LESTAFIFVAIRRGGGQTRSDFPASFVSLEFLMSEGRRASVPAVPILPQEDFAYAKRIFRDFDCYSTYDDWLDHQEGIQVGYLMSGVDARLIKIRVAAFLKWCDQQRIPPGEQTLVRFAEAVGEQMTST
jgi:hypothetical protein